MSDTPDDSTTTLFVNVQRTRTVTVNHYMAVQVPTALADRSRREELRQWLVAEDPDEWTSDIGNDDSIMPIEQDDIYRIVFVHDGDDPTATAGVHKRHPAWQRSLGHKVSDDLGDFVPVADAIAFMNGLSAPARQLLALLAEHTDVAMSVDSITALNKPLLLGIADISASIGEINRLSEQWQVNSPVRWWKAPDGAPLTAMRSNVGLTIAAALRTPSNQENDQ